MTLRVVGTPPNMIGSTDGTRDRIRAALPVAGPGQWYEMAVGVNWLAGSGGALASQAMQYTLISPGSTETRRFYVWPRAAHQTWLWVIELRSDYVSTTETPEGARGTITVTPGGDSFSFALDGDTPKRCYITPDPSSVATGEATVAVTVNSDSGSGVFINSITLQEVRRGFLDLASDTVGAYASSCEKGNAIYEDTTYDNKVSAQGVWEQVRDAKTASRRNKLFDWWDTAGVTITTTSYPGTSNILAIDPAVQARNTTGGGSTTRAVKVNVYAMQTGGGSSEVRFTAATGGTATITITTASASWHTPTSFTIETDDLSTASTIRGGTRDTVLVEVRRVSGTSVTVYGIGIGEDS